MQAAAKSGCDVAVILGEDERAAGTATVKDMRRMRQTRAGSLEELLQAVQRAQLADAAGAAEPADGWSTTNDAGADGWRARF